MHTRLTRLWQGRKVGTFLHQLFDRWTLTGVEMKGLRDALSPRAPRRRQMHLLRIHGDLKRELCPRNEGP